jgi:hypothetical protein
MPINFTVQVVNTKDDEYEFEAKGLTLEQAIESITALIPHWTSAVIVITPKP